MCTNIERRRHAEQQTPLHGWKKTIPVCPPRWIQISASSVPLRPRPLLLFCPTETSWRKGDGALAESEPVVEVWSVQNTSTVKSRRMQSPLYNICDLLYRYRTHMCSKSTVTVRLYICSTLQRGLIHTFRISSKFGDDSQKLTGQPRIRSQNISWKSEKLYP